MNFGKREFPIKIFREFPFPNLVSREMSNGNSRNILIGKAISRELKNRSRKVGLEGLTVIKKTFQNLRPILSFQNNGDSKRFLGVYVHRGGIVFRKLRVKQLFWEVRIYVRFIFFICLF